MEERQQTRASPTGFTSLKEWVLYVVGWHLEKKGVAKAQDRLEDLGKANSFMDGWPEAERAATDMIDRYAQNLNLKDEERKQRTISEMMAGMMGVVQQAMMQQMTANKAAIADTTLLKGVDLSDDHIRYCLERLMEERYNGTEEMLFNRKCHWQGVFRVLSDAGMYGDDDFGYFDLLINRVKPLKVNASYSRSSVKNISQTLFNKPFVKWRFESGGKTRREPYDRMVAIVKRFIMLLEAPEKH